MLVVSFMLTVLFPCTYRVSLRQKYLYSNNANNLNNGVNESLMSVFSLQRNFMRSRRTVYLDDSQLKELDKVVANCENADGNDEPPAWHLEKLYEAPGWKLHFFLQTVAVGSRKLRRR